MNEAEKKSVPRKIVAALGMVCIILVALLGSVIVAYTTEVNTEKSQISMLNSDVNSTLGLLFTYFPNLQNQSISALNLTGATFVTISQINLDPAKWEDQKVAVIGRLSGPLASPVAISYYYVLSLNETVASSIDLGVKSIGVDFGNRGAIYNSSPTLVVGEVKKGEIGTNVAGAQPTTIYYIEEQAVLTL